MRIEQYILPGLQSKRDIFLYAVVLFCILIYFCISLYVIILQKSEEKNEKQNADTSVVCCKFNNCLL